MLTTTPLLPPAEATEPRRVNGVHPTTLIATSRPADRQATMTPDPRPADQRHQLDADLAKSVRHAAHMRRGFYIVVLLVALAGQVWGAVEALGIPVVWAIPAVGALELGGVVVMANADVRRRLGERAIGSRLLSAAIAVGAVAFNWLAHASHLAGGFFAGMSALGYLVWLTHVENQRRDRLRATGDLPPTTPAYEVVGHWLSHPWITRRAKSLAKANSALGLYESLAAAREEIRRERRDAGIAKVLRRKMRAAVDPTTADIAIRTFDLPEVASRLAAGADYGGLTALIAADLVPARFAVAQPTQRRRWWARPKVGANPPSGRLVLSTAPSVDQPTATSAHRPTPTEEAAHQPTGPAHPTPDQLEPTWAPSPPPAQPTPTSSAPMGGAAQAGPGRAPIRKKAQVKAAQPTGPAHPTTDGLTELQRTRLGDLRSEFPDDLPGRDKVMAHMRAKGYEGWASKQPAHKLIGVLRAERAAAVAHQPTGPAHPTQPTQPTPTETESPS